jgi:hypothetical protein
MSLFDDKKRSDSLIILKRVFKTEINHFRFNAPTIDIPVSFNFNNRIEFWNWYK